MNKVADSSHTVIDDTGCGEAKKRGYTGGCIDCPFPRCLEDSNREMKQECGINGSIHIWNRQPYTRDIDRGVCDCGAVRYLPRNSKDSTTRECRRLNDKKGKPGKVYRGPPLPAENISHETKLIEAKNISTMLDIKEENMELTEAQKKIYDTTQNPVSPPDVKPENLPPVTTKEHPAAYTIEEKKAIVAEGKAAGTKAGRRAVAKKYNINLYQLHAWDVNFNRAANPSVKKEMTPARKEQLANARAARGKNKVSPPPPSTPPQQFACAGDCSHIEEAECPGRKNGLKITTNPALDVPYCPHYKALEKKEVNCPWDCVYRGDECPAEKAGMKASALYKEGDAPCGYYIPPRKEPEKPAPGPEIKTILIKYEIDSSPVEAEIERVQNRIKFLNNLRAVCLPRFRWYWVFFPTTVKQYFSALRELVGADGSFNDVQDKEW